MLRIRKRSAPHNLSTAAKHRKDARLPPKHRFQEGLRNSCQLRLAVVKLHLRVYELGFELSAVILISLL